METNRGRESGTNVRQEGGAVLRAVRRGDKGGGRKGCERLQWRREEEESGVLCCRSSRSVGESVGGRGERLGGGSCVPAHPVCALQGQGLGLVWGCRTGRAAEGGAVGGRGVTGGVRVLEGGVGVTKEEGEKFRN